MKALCIGFCLALAVFCGLLGIVSAALIEGPRMFGAAVPLFVASLLAAGVAISLMRPGRAS